MLGCKIVAPIWADSAKMQLNKSRRWRVYHQHEVLYIIKPQENTRWRVMRYEGGSAVVGDIHRTPRDDNMPSLWLG